VAALALAAVAVALALGATAQPATFDVTVTATQVTTITCLDSPQVDETLEGTIASTAPGRATLRGNALTFAHDGDLPLALTLSASYVGCTGSHPHGAHSCGTATKPMVPGGNLDYAGGRLLLSYDNNKQMFSEPDSCSSGVTEVARMPIAFDPHTLLARRVTVVNGTYSHDITLTTNGTESLHWDVRFSIRFARH